MGRDSAGTCARATAHDPARALLPHRPGRPARSARPARALAPHPASRARQISPPRPGTRPPPARSPRPGTCPHRNRPGRLDIRRGHVKPTGQGRCPPTRQGRCPRTGSQAWPRRTRPSRGCQRRAGRTTRAAPDDAPRGRPVRPAGARAGAGAVGALPGRCPWCRLSLVRHCPSAASSGPGPTRLATPASPAHRQDGAGLTPVAGRLRDRPRMVPRAPAAELARSARVTRYPLRA